ncbi:cobalt-precorrin-6A reductase [Microvirga sp. 2MCAF38]|uniref:cobalt-precorrin-6A reductase n=1 Tax=Microvirga sp. 2MCAF38 TaxID=3232989 RepID=UPI003F9E3182
MRILILGGTTEASALAGRLAERTDIAAVLSLAGRTAAPKRAAIITRIGGFGGIEGLKQWLVEHHTDAVIDATHPFAARISHNAAMACGALDLPLLALRRPAWQPVTGDLWREVASMKDAVEALGRAPRRVFLTVGRLELRHFASAPQHHYLVRTIEPLGDALPVPHVTAIEARGPFDEEAERDLMIAHRIEILATKNSGGAATYGKIVAARTLSLPVIIVTQPQKSDADKVETADAAMVWIDHHVRIP